MKQKRVSYLASKGIHAKIKKYNQMKVATPKPMTLKAEGFSSQCFTAIQIVIMSIGSRRNTASGPISSLRINELNHIITAMTKRLKRNNRISFLNSGLLAFCVRLLTFIVYQIRIQFDVTLQRTPPLYN